MEISEEINPSPDLISFSCSSPINADPEKKNSDQWRKVFRTFDLIKDKTPVNNKIKFRKGTSSRKKQSLYRLKEFKHHHRKTTVRRSILSSSFTNTLNEINDSQENFNESEIVWSSSNEESDTSLGIENSVNNKGLKRNHNETEINWSSSESDNDCNSPSQQIQTCTPKQIDSDRDLDLFIKEIEKDLRRSKSIKQKITSRREGYANSFHKAIKKAKADTAFLDYEHRTEIIEGLKGVIAEKQVAYGSCFANVELETGSNECIFLEKNLQINDIVGKSVVCFLDEANCYRINGKNVYIQPNKVIKA